MCKYFIVSDVHSFYTELLVALNEKGFEKDNPEHKLIVCGDLFDRGDQTVQLFEFVKSLGDRFIYVRGNHEDLLEDCLCEIKKGWSPSRHHHSNGTVKTICHLCGENEWIMRDASWLRKVEDIMTPIMEYINNKTVNYFDIGDKYVCVHGWWPVHDFVDDYHTAEDWLWKDARWKNGMEMWKFPGCRIKGKTVICGHWHCSWGWSHIRQERKEWPQKNRSDWKKSFEPFVDEGIMAIDACTAYTGKVNCVVIEA